jgi:hypothetical protein
MATIGSRLRFNILARDGFRCRYCGRRPESWNELHVDHIKPRAKGGTNEESNLIAACEDCNRGKYTFTISDKLKGIILSFEPPVIRSGKWSVDFSNSKHPSVSRDKTKDMGSEYSFELDPRHSIGRTIDFWIVQLAEKSWCSKLELVDLAAVLWRLAVYLRDTR